jgi:hypothetical protein
MPKCQMAPLATFRVTRRLGVCQQLQAAASTWLLAPMWSCLQEWRHPQMSGQGEPRRKVTQSATAQPYDAHHQISWGFSDPQYLLLQLIGKLLLHDCEVWSGFLQVQRPTGVSGFAAATTPWMESWPTTSQPFWSHQMSLGFHLQLVHSRKQTMPLQAGSRMMHSSSMVCHLRK